jgi:hypothetical protein
MMDQKRIGWTYWQQPPIERAPAVSFVRPLESGAIGVSLPGFPFAWPENDIFQPRPGPAPIVEGDARATSFEIFNRSEKPVTWTAKARDPWAALALPGGSPQRLETLDGSLEGGDVRTLIVVVDWSKVPADAKTATVEVSGMGSEGPCRVVLHYPLERKPDTTLPWVGSGAVALDAASYSKAVEGRGISWSVLKDFGIGYGRDAVTAFPSVHSRIEPASGTPHLEYDLYFAKAGEIGVQLQVAPTLNFLSGDGIQVAVSMDGEAPQILTVGTKVGSPDWDRAVAGGVRKLDAKVVLDAPGVHTFKVWYVDPGVVLRQVIFNTAAMRPSYLGPLGLGE